MLCMVNFGWFRSQRSSFFCVDALAGDAIIGILADSAGITVASMILDNPFSQKLRTISSQEHLDDICQLKLLQFLCTLKSLILNLAKCSIWVGGGFL